MDVLRGLIRQHDRIEERLAALVRLGSRSPIERRKGARSLFEEILRQLEEEERSLFDRVEPRLILVGCQGYREDHARIRAAVQILQTADGEALTEGLKMLQALVVRVASDEEIELYPEVRRRFHFDELEEMGRSVPREPGSRSDDSIY